MNGDHASGHGDDDDEYAEPTDSPPRRPRHRSLSKSRSPSSGRSVPLQDDDRPFAGDADMPVRPHS